MVTIMLVCSAGMSTSLFVTKMKKAAKNKNIEVDIFAVSASEVDEVLSKKHIDLLLLAPQVKFMKEQMEEKLKGKSIPIDFIDMRDYGLLNGEKVLEKAIKLIQK